MRAVTARFYKTKKKVIEFSDDEVSEIQAHCFLGECYFETENYVLAKEHLDYWEQLNQYRYTVYANF